MAFARTLLLILTVIVFCCGAESSCRIWSDHGDIVITGNYVFCQCNISGVQSSDIQFTSQEFLYSTEIVDNITVKAKIPLYPYRTGNTNCFAKESGLSPIKVIPKLEHKYFMCRLYLNEDNGNCSFLPHLQTFQEAEFFLSANGLPKVKCGKVKQNFGVEELSMMCKNININKNLTTNVFKIEMKLMGLIQHNEIILHRNKMAIPSLEFIKVGFQGESICNCTSISSQYDNLICKWVYDSSYFESARTKNLILTLEDHEALMCVSEKDFGYKNIYIEICCRFGKRFPWSERYRYDCKTPAILPSQPPHILSNGFFYDPDHKQLHIFWFHLDKEKWNGPSFEYIAKTDHG